MGRRAGSAAATRALGEYGENLAARHLLRQGMVLLDHNWRCRAGEIDLVLRDRSTLVFCEVKTRRSAAYGTPFEAVTTDKAERLRRLAAAWLAAHEVHAPEVRFDLVGVTCPRHRVPRVEHLRGVC